jgi:hypothetical protein
VGLSLLVQDRLAAPTPCSLAMPSPPSTTPPAAATPRRQQPRDQRAPTAALAPKSAIVDEKAKPGFVRARIDDATRQLIGALPTGQGLLGVVIEDTSVSPIRVLPTN